MTVSKNFKYVVDSRIPIPIVPAQLFSTLPPELVRYINDVHRYTKSTEKRLQRIEEQVNV